jgi:hypothetical protein
VYRKSTACTAVPAYRSKCSQPKQHCRFPQRSPQENTSAGAVPSKTRDALSSVEPSFDVILSRATLVCNPRAAERYPEIPPDVDVPILPGTHYQLVRIIRMRGRQIE